MAALDQNSSAVVLGLARHLNCLGEDDKLSRRKALESIKKDTIDRKPSLDASELQSVFNTILKHILIELCDSAEKCRELSLDIIRKLFRAVSFPEEYLPYILPVLVQRLGQQEIIESSEEMRLSLLEFLKEILEYSGKKIAIYLDDLIKILQKTILDPYPEVKKISCECSCLVAKTIPEHFHLQSESLIKPLLLSVSHQHSKVRSVVLYTIACLIIEDLIKVHPSLKNMILCSATTQDFLGDVIQYGNGKSVETVVPHLAQRLFDQTPAVRMAVTKVVGTWLLDLMDRYSFWHKLIPLLLTSLSDEQPEIREVADSFWHDIGLKFEKENEEDFKDKSDFPKAEPSHYPPGVERPNMGCRTLIFRNLSKILPALMHDVVDWVTETRKKSAALLYYLLLNAEQYITQHLEMVTTGMYRACSDEEADIVRDTQKAAELIGYFVDAEVWSKLILKAVQKSQSFNTLMVLAAVVRGTLRADLKAHLQAILNTLYIPEVCHSAQVPVQKQILSCLNSVMIVCDVDINESSQASQTIFNLLHTVLALQQGELIKDQVFELLNRLAALEGLDTYKELYKRHTKPLLETFHNSYGDWATHSVERLVFDVLVLEAGPVVGDLLDDVIPILKANFQPEKDPEVRLKFFSLLSHLMMNSKTTLDSSDRFTEFAEIVIHDMILPNCVWRAGRVAAAIRTTAVSCAWALLQSGVLTKQKIEPILDNFITQMLACMDDDNKNTRLVACRVMTRTFDLAGTSVNQDRLHNMYIEFLKRLDDSVDEIRVTVCKTFLAYLDSFGIVYDVDLYRAHLVAIYQGLLVHLDDPDEKIQEAVLGVLKKAGGLLPGMLIQEVESAKHKHRTKKYCDELVAYLHTLTTS